MELMSSGEQAASTMFKPSFEPDKCIATLNTGRGEDNSDRLAVQGDQQPDTESSSVGPAYCKLCTMLHRAEPIQPRAHVQRLYGELWTFGLTTIRDIPGHKYVKGRV